MKQAHKKNGYLYITLHKNIKQITYRTHRLIILAFKLNIENKPLVNHEDGIKSNNRINNLEWCTERENSKHAVKNGLLIPPKNVWKGKFGKDHFASKKIAQLNLNGDLIKIFHGQQEAERETGVPQSNIWKVLNNKRITAGNYKWIYI